MKARDIILTALVGFLVTWSALSAFSLLQALVGFTEHLCRARYQISDPCNE